MEATCNYWLGNIAWSEGKSKTYEAQVECENQRRGYQAVGCMMPRSNRSPGMVS